MATIAQRESPDDGGLPIWAEYTSQSIVVYSIVTFSIETHQEYRGDQFFAISEWIVVVLFTAEYLWRLRSSGFSRRYALSPYGAIDALAILPGILTLGIADARFVRIFRLFSLLRLVKFVRYSRSVNRLVRAFLEIRGELALFGFATTMIVYLSSVGIYYFERNAQPEAFGSITQSLWWAIVTLTTVGYGDSFPVTVGGKVFTAIVLLIGLGTVAVPSGLLASSLQRVKDPE